MTNNATMKGGALIGVKLVASQLTVGYLTNGMNEIPMV